MMCMTLFPTQLLLGQVPRLKQLPSSPSWIVQTWFRELVHPVGYGSDELTSQELTWSSSQHSTP
ncbi:hypothetical protein OUZ56_009308 [Daphnia magna]|uniref:Uncharacterized protein n=1 Tax=Daphnia magna TaxID=35525 RepID=A0ABR0AFM7_9CRUS|nr:hypothetical protein OUZ56_009308 [Daphnia magna]